MLGERLAGDEALVADRTLETELAGVILHMIAQLNGRREGFFAFGALERSLFVVHEFDVLLELVSLRIAFRTEHADVRPIVGVRTAIMLLEMGFSGVRCSTILLNRGGE